MKKSSGFQVWPQVFRALHTPTGHETNQMFICQVIVSLKQVEHDWFSNLPSSALSRTTVNHHCELQSLISSSKL